MSLCRGWPGRSGKREPAAPPGARGRAAPGALQNGFIPGPGPRAAAAALLPGSRRVFKRGGG